MKNITRTFTLYSIKAYDLVESENSEPSISVIGECLSMNTCMTRSMARAELAEAIGEKMAKGVTIKWTPVQTVTYAMPLDKFIESATVVAKEEIR